DAEREREQRQVDVQHAVSHSLTSGSGVCGWGTPGGGGCAARKETVRRANGPASSAAALHAARRPPGGPTTPPSSLMTCPRGLRGADRVERGGTGDVIGDARSRASS